METQTNLKRGVSHRRRPVGPHSQLNEEYQNLTTEVESKQTLCQTRIGRPGPQSNVRPKAKEKDRYYVEAKAEVEAQFADALAEAKSRFEEELKVYIDALNRAEEEARAESEEMQEAEARLRAEAEEKEIYYAEEIARVKDRIEKAKAEFKAQSEVYSKALLRAEEKAKVEAEKRVEAEEKLSNILRSLRICSTCECCGRADIPVSDLAKIDSGQLLCPDCFKALREQR
jgi:membrane protein involved in colicin uptake